MSEAAAVQQDPEEKPSRKRRNMGRDRFVREFVMRRSVTQPPASCVREADEAFEKVTTDCGDDFAASDFLLEFLAMNACQPIGVGSLMRTGREAFKALS